MKISVVSPVYNAEKILGELVSRISKELIEICDSHEIILVDDRGPDRSWEVIETLCKNNPHVKGVKLSRNFGQHAAIKAGLSEVTGDCCIVLDCDLQHDPKYFKSLVYTWQEKKVEVVFAVTPVRKHSLFKNFSAKVFNSLFNFLVDDKQLSGSNAAGSFSLISRKVVDAFVSFNDYQFHYLMVLRWLGYSHAQVVVEHAPRFEGKGSYTFGKLVEHAIVAITYQSSRLLTINIMIGFVIASLSVLGGIAVVVRYLMYGAQAGWPSLFVLMLFTLGAVLASIGVIGLYIGKMFDQVKSRPQFLIDEKLNID